MKLQVFILDNAYIGTGMGTSLWKNGTLKYYAKDRWDSVQQAQQFLDSWLPPKEWITQEYVKEQAKISGCAALDCSITHWKQILLAGYDGYKKAYYLHKTTMDGEFCALCMYKQIHYKHCSDCILGDCNKEKSLWQKTSYATKDNWEKSIIPLLNKLITIRNEKYGNPYLEEQKMSDGMIEINGQKFSESTILEWAKGALKKACKSEEKYIFKAGDVVEYRANGMVSRRVVVNVNDKLWGISVDNGRNTVTGQDNFEAFGYKKIGELKNYL